MSFQNFLIIMLMGIALFVFTRPDTLPEMGLQTVNQGEIGDYKRYVGGNCEGEKCLTVYVSPNCPTSPRITSMLVSLAEQLESEDIEMNIIVGDRSAQNAFQFANRYPFEVYLDPRMIYFDKVDLGFTPTFIITNNKGEIVDQRSIAFLDVSIMRDKLGI